MKPRMCGNCGSRMGLKAYDTLKKEYIWECKICGSEFKEGGNNQWT